MFINGNAIYLFIAVASLISISTNKKTVDKGRKLFLQYSIFLLIVVLLNPVFRLMANHINMMSDQVFARFWIMCPIWLIIAYSITNRSECYNNSLARSVFVLMSTLVIVLAGSNVENNNMFIVSDNSSKINTAAIEISNEILELSDGKPVSLLIRVDFASSSGNYVNGGSIYEGMLQYTGKIETIPHYYTEEEWNSYYVSEMTPYNEMTTEEFIKQSLSVWEDMYNFDYIAWPDDERLVSKLHYCGYEVVGHAGGYYIYAKE